MQRRKSRWQTFQSTLPLRGATGALRPVSTGRRFQSTLPLRGATCATVGSKPPFCGFQSTLPLRGATCSWISASACCLISIHAPLTGSDYRPQKTEVRPTDFNPRSPYGERLLSLSKLFHWRLFQSTLPLRGATNIPPHSLLLIDISIHAPLTGSDAAGNLAPADLPDFNPRSPYGERPALKYGRLEGD